MISPEFTYLLKVNLALILFYAFYRLICTNDTFFRWRRFALLGFMGVAWIYPLLNFQNWFHQQAPIQEAVTYAQSMYTDVLVMGPEPAQRFSLFTSQTLAILFYSVLAILGIRFLVQFFLIFRLSRNSKKTVLNGTTIRLLQKETGPFSFFHWIFFHPTMLENAEEAQEVLTHELTHARQLHTIDILIAELNCILCWINPFAWLLKQEIRNNLEYLADHQVVQTGFDTKTYQYHLLGLAHQKVNPTIYTHFKVLPIKKRIMMMNRKRSKKIGRTKYFLFIPLAALLLIFSNIESIARSTTQLYAKFSEVISEPSALKSTYAADENGQKEFVLITLNGILHPEKLNIKEITADNETFAEFVGITADDIGEISIHKDKKELEKLGYKGIAGVISIQTKSYLEKQGITVNPHKAPFLVMKSGSKTIARNSNEDPDEIYDNPEVLAQFKGGEQELYKFLSENLVYPKKAIKDRVQGKVFLRLTIEKDGSVNEIEVIRSLSPETDKEAIRVTQLMPKWEPAQSKGKKVRSSFVLPFIFRLE